MTADQAPPEARRRPWGNVVALCAFIIVPFLASLVGFWSGPTEEEQRTATSFPAILDDPLDDHRWAELGDWHEDRLPLRAEAIEIERDIASLIDDRIGRLVEQSDQVTAGADGWLFLNESLRQPCYTARQQEEWLAEIDRAATLIVGTGRQLVIAIAPDREIVAASKVRGGANECQIANRDVVKALAARPDVIDLSTVVNQEVHALRLDTHWSPTGAMAGAELIVGAIDPALWDVPAVEHTTIQRQGDLQRIIGDDSSEEIDLVTFARQELTVTAKNAQLLVARTPGSADLNVMAAHDSYGGVGDVEVTGAGADYLRPWFSTFSSIRLQGGSNVFLGEEPAASALRDADVLVLLFVQRAIVPRFGTGLLTGPLIGALIDELDPVDVTIAGDAARTVIDPVGPGALVIDGLHGSAADVAVDAATGRILSRSDMTDRIVVVVTEGTALTIADSGIRVRFVPHSSSGS